MKFGQKFSLRKGLTTPEFAKGIWNPSNKLWRDIIEDYLTISRKRIGNKLWMFKLQLIILFDIVDNIKIIDGYKKKKKEFDELYKSGKFDEKEYKYQKSFFKSEIFSSKLINKALKEIMDGIVWRYFNFNRAILYALADKEPIDVIRPDKGLVNTLHEFSEKFLHPDEYAILNDITNFLRVGDVTHIKEDGTIEIVEVKSGKQRTARVKRQKKKMIELVEFFNTKTTKKEGLKYKIIDSNTRQKTYLKQLLDGIKLARHKGYESILIGDYLILEIVDFESSQYLKGDNIFTDYFSNKHKKIKEKWVKNKDYIHHCFLIEKMNYSKNTAPYTIFPFPDEIIADLLIGKLMISEWFNVSEIFRKIESSGWKIVDFLLAKNKEELEDLKKYDHDDVTFLKVKKGRMSLDVPPAWFA